MRMSTPVIAIVTDAIAPYHRGGKEQRYDELAPRLTLYADVHVYTMRWWRGHRATTRRGGVAYHAICPLMPLYRGQRRSIGQAVMFALASLKLSLVRFDVLEADHMPYLQLFPLKLVVLLRRKRLVVTWHEVWDRAQWSRYLGRAGPIAWWLEQLAMRLPDCIIAASPQTAERLIERIGDRVPVVVAPNGIDLDLVVGTPPADDPADVVTVGRLLHHKRFDMVLDAIASLAQAGKPTTCRIIGDGPERRALTEQATRLGIGHLVDFRHEVHTSAELLSLLKASRTFAFPSEREGFGIAALEAIACGLPVITTTSPENLARHLVQRSARGVLCDHHPQALAAAIESQVSAAVAAPPEVDREWLAEYDWTAITARIARALVLDGVPPRIAGNGAVDPERTEAARTAAARPALPGPAAPPPAQARPALPGPAPPLVQARPALPAPAAAAPPAEPPPAEQPSAPSAPGPPTTRARVLDLMMSLLAVGAIAGLANVRGAWILQLTELALLLCLPGLLVARAVRAEAQAIRRFPIYVVCASLAVVMVAGLLVDLVGPGLGISRPLATVPLAVSVAVSCVLLLVIGAIRRAPLLADYIGGSLRIAWLWPLLLPVIAWAGAMRLNNGHGAAVAIAAVSATGIALLAGVWAAPRWGAARTGLLLFGAALALMWGFSLRGHFVYGFDISGEYQTFIQVLHAGRWHTSHHNDAYGAMLSLTILPSALTTLTGASPLLVLKVIFPLLFAFFPVAVYLLATRALSVRFAYIAVLFIVVQDYLFQQLPAIARQEIALLFFVCLVAAMLDGRLRRGSQIGLLGVFGFGLVLSHYGTTYITVVLLAGALVLELARWLVTAGVRRAPLRAGIRPALLPLLPLAAALAITGAGAAIWYQPVTGSAQNLSGFVDDLNDQGLSLLPNAGGQGVLRSYLSGNTPTHVSGSSYAADVRSDYVKNDKYVHPIPQAFLPRFRVQSATVPGERVKSRATVDGLDAAQILVSQLSILLAAIGALLLWLRRDAGAAARALALLGVSTLAMLVLIRFSGTAANDYNQNRAFLQAMVPLSVCLAWVLEQFSRQRRFGPYIAGAFTVALGLLFLNSSGLRGTFAGGGTLTNLAASGEDYERYFVTEPELAAAHWLNASAAPGAIISADRYGQLRINGATGRTNAVLGNVTPSSLDRGAWIYADSANFTGLRARGLDGSEYATYVWPSFIDRYWNLVYSNGSSGVYKRAP
jgi:glycosyltransferase involved in cell wall biosynthesis